MGGATRPQRCLFAVCNFLFAYGVADLTSEGAMGAGGLTSACLNPRFTDHCEDAGGGESVYQVIVKVFFSGSGVRENSMGFDALSSSPAIFFAAASANG